VFGRKTQFDKVVRRLADQPLRDSIGPVSVALADVQLSVPVEGDSSTAVQSELKLLAGADREGNLWAHAYTLHSHFTKAFPAGCGAATIELAKFVGVVDQVDGLAGIMIDAGSPWAYPIFKSAFALVREALCLRPAECDHDPLYEEARFRLSPHLEYHGQTPAELTASSERELRRGVELLLRVLSINPKNWAAMWMVGKAHQRLREFELAFEWFKRADEAHPGQPDVNREAAIAAMEIDRPELAIFHCRQAIEARSDDPGLRANLALALLFSGSPCEAMDAARDALSRDPSDEITKRIVELCEEVVAGKRACPRHQREI
jgi:tetratricopeptide (TPR) repeat protein